MIDIDPGQAPKKGEHIEVEHEGRWEEAIVTAVSEDRVFGEVLGKSVPTSFSYTLSSYRRNWRWSQRRP